METTTASLQKHRFIVVVFALLAPAVSGCGLLNPFCMGKNFITCRAPARIVKGPEATDLIQRAHGCIVINQGWDTARPERPGILAICLPTLTRKVLRHSAKNYLNITGVSGPDLLGNILFTIAEDSPNEMFMGTGISESKLKAIRVDGSNERELSPISPSQNLFLSPVGSLVAYVNQGGLLTLWDLKKSVSEVTEVKVLDNKNIAWFPDGKRLLYVASYPRDQVGGTLLSTPYGKEYLDYYSNSKSELPVICLFNISTRETKPVAMGDTPLLSPDGKALLTKVRDKWLVVNFGTSKVEQHTIPDSWGRPLFLLNDNLVIFVAYPTKGAKLKWTKYGSFGAGNLMPSLKIGEIGTWRFQTIFSSVDMRDEMSFGIPASAN